MILRLALIVLILSGCRPDETVSAFVDPNARFDLVQINGRPAGGATIVFPEPGVVSGRAHCNSYSAEQRAPYPWLELGPIRATRASCADLDAEEAYFSLLARMTLIEVSGNTLILQNDSGEEMVFQSKTQ